MHTLPNTPIVLPNGEILSQEPPLENELHLRQIMILLQSLELAWRARNDFYACGNLTIYYSPNQRKSEDFRGPDFFVVLGTERKPRSSWVVWQEGGRYPNVIVEILSPATVPVDRGLKKEIYQNTFHTPEYFWFDPASLEFQGFVLEDGVYQPLAANTQGHLWSQELGLWLGIWQGKLRFFELTGAVVPTPEEAAVIERERAERLTAQLRGLGIEPEV